MARGAFGTIEGEVSPTVRAPVYELRDRFVAHCYHCTLQACTNHLDEFMRFADAAMLTATFRLFSEGQATEFHIAIAYAVDLRRCRLGPATIERRLGTLPAQPLR